MTCERALVLTGPRPDVEGTAEQRRLDRLIMDAARRWPKVRWTVASIDGRPVTRPDELGDAGVEAVTGEASWDDWLAGRRYHYGIVAVADPRWSDGPLDTALRATQPQAVRVPLADPVELGALAASLGRC